MPMILSYDNVGYIMDHLGTTIVDAENGRGMIDYLVEPLAPLLRIPTNGPRRLS